MKILLFNIILFFSSLAYSQTDTLKWQEFKYGDGSISSEGNFYNGQPEGEWRSYYPNHQLKSVGNWHFNKLEGIWIFFANNGDTTEVISYRSGLKNGWTKKYKNGILKTKTLFLNDQIVGLSYEYDNNYITEFPYKNSLKHGLAFKYDSTKKIIEVKEFKNGFMILKKSINKIINDSLKQGEWLSFYPNRKLHIEANYIHDTLDGYFREYDQNGQLLVNLLYKNGALDTTNYKPTQQKFIQTFYDNGNLKSEGYFNLDNLPIGLHVESSADQKLIHGILYNEEGVAIGKGILNQDHQKDGHWQFFYNNGDLQAEGDYKKNLRTKEWKFYREEGGLEQVGHYKSGLYSGEWILYYSDNQIFIKENYKKSKLDGLFEQFNEDGSLFVKGSYTEDLKDGDWWYYYPFMDIKEIYTNGEKTGKWQQTYKNGRLAFEGKYEANEPNGVHRTYYQNGNTKLLATYIYGSKEKIWTYYKSDGTELISYTYKNDELIKINGVRVKDLP
ncbi:MAG: hypothetical protein JXR60_02985 [Bacteroidales bacterium]|nr:hypothetical protein [Bacteroidales bacterium]